MAPKAATRKRSVATSSTSTGNVEDTLARLREFSQIYGGKPCQSSELGKAVHLAMSRVDDTRLSTQFAELWNDAPAMQKGTVATADKFLRAVRGGRDVSKFAAWAARTRCRLELMDSELSRALALQNSGAGLPAAKRLKRQANRGTGSSAHPAVNTDGSVAAVVLNTVAGPIPMTPAVVVNWLYQCLVDVFSKLQHVLGQSGSFGASGEMLPHATCLGEVVLWWGTHLGCIRDQGLIAWDYDVDLAVFLRDGVSFDGIWASARKPLLALGYNLTTISKSKFRVSPKDPLTWAPFQELYHEVQEAAVGTGADRGHLNKQASALFAQGRRARKPHGKNCLDIDVYMVKPGKQIRIMGSKPFSLDTATLFPTAKGVLGPLRLPIPRTSAVLTAEYGADCIKKRRVKVMSAKGSVKEWKDVPDGVRRIAWPYERLSRAGDLYT